MSAHGLNPSQQNAVCLTGHDILVTAGAGTGKTTVLVERAVHKLRHGDIASLDELLVVTFTDKAAREMKHRLYREMLDDPSLRRFLPQLPRAWISTIHAFCARLLRERFLEAKVEPGFRILSEHGQVEAFDDSLRRVFHEWYGRSGQAEGKRFISLVEMAGFDAEGEVLRRIVRSIYDFSRATPDPEAYLESLVSGQPASRLDELPWYGAIRGALFGERPGVAASDSLWNRALSLYRAAVHMAGPVNPARMRRFLGVLESVPTSDLMTPEGQHRLFDSLAEADLMDTGGALADALPRAPGGANRIPGFKELHDAAKALFRGTALAQLPWNGEALLREDCTQREFLHVLVRMVREVDRLYMQYKSRQGYLDFSDLEIHAARLIREHGEALGWRNRFSEILVDEFQDVNPLQDGILSAFCRPDGGFRVGDVKQSIYQFRLADPTIFLNRARSARPVRDPSVVPGGSDPLLLFLGENYRSRPEILQFVNHLFTGIFDEGVIGSPYEDHALVAGRSPGAEDVPVELHLLARREMRDDAETGAESTEDASAARYDRPDRREAVFTARRIRRLIEEERPQVPGFDGGTRTATYADVAILLRSRAKADLYLQALEEAGVPAYRQEGGSLVQEEGVRDLRTLLSVIDNPRDDVALAAVLRSPLVGIDDGDLVRIRLAWPGSRTFLDAVAAVAYGDRAGDARGMYFPPATDGSSLPEDGPSAEIRFWTGPPGNVPDDWIAVSLGDRLRDFMDRLAGWRLMQGRMELGRFLSRVCVESGLEAVLPGRPDPALQRVAVERFLSLARAFEAERGPSLHAFLARISLQETTGTLDGVSRSQEGQDAVALLTVHKAKGLEFPVVVLPQLHWGFRNDSLGDQIRVGEQWIGLRELDHQSWGRRDTWPRRALELLQRRRQREEEARILYVALTRARERLILVATPRSNFTMPDELPPPHVREVLVREKGLSATSALDWIMACIPWADRIGESGNRDPAAAQSIRTEFRSLPLVLWSHAAFPAIEPAESVESEEEKILAWKRNLLDGLPAGTARDPESVQPAERERAHPATARAEAALADVLIRVSSGAKYPPLADLLDLKGKYWVTELKGPYDQVRSDDLAEEGGGLWIPASFRESLPEEPPSGEEPSGAVSGHVPDLREHQKAAGLRGTVYHTAISRLDLSAVSPRQLDAQFSRMSGEPWWEGVKRDPVLEAGIARFFSQDHGIRLRSAWEEDPRSVEREAAFSLRFPVRELASLRPGLAAAIESDPRWSHGSWAGALDDTWVLIQGRIDCVFREGARWILIDWKTDRVFGSRLDDRAALYADQMRLYSRAVEQLWGPLAAAWLVFPVAGRTVAAPST